MLTKPCFSEAVVKVAEAEVGYKAKGSSSADLDSKTKDAAKNGLYTKYARDLDALKNFYNGRKQGHDWCDVFVDWCFVTAYGRENGQELICQPDKSLGAGVKYSWGYYKAKQQISTDPIIGAQIFFANAQTNYAHTGIVVDMDAKYIWTVEGNVSKSGYRVVAKQKYKKDYKWILGYGIPAYTVAPQVIYTVVKGDSLWKIAKKYYGAGINYKKIMKANNLTSTKIYPGQKLVILAPDKK